MARSSRVLCIVIGSAMIFMSLWLYFSITTLKTIIRDIQVDGTIPINKPSPDTIIHDADYQNLNSEDFDVYKLHSRYTIPSLTEIKDPNDPFANSHTSKRNFTINCPDKPTKNYPLETSMREILNNWPTDDTNIPKFHYDSLCHFNYQDVDDKKKIMNYQAAEVPYIVYNYPPSDETVIKWSDLEYLKSKIGNYEQSTELSETNHFMYYRIPKKMKPSLRASWKPPTTKTSMKFKDFLEHGLKQHNVTLSNRKHAYLRVSSRSPMKSKDNLNYWLYQDMPWFDPPKKQNNIVMRGYEKSRGIHCRFGMKAVTAETHFDGSRNAIFQIRGMRRWIIVAPKHCNSMYLYAPGHPSSRHSRINWSAPDYHQFPLFANAGAIEIVMQPGDLLYLPTFWMHFIVSLNMNAQCNSRSGVDFDKDRDNLKKCGFYS